MAPAGAKRAGTRLVRISGWLKSPEYESINYPAHCVAKTAKHRKIRRSLFNKLSRKGLMQRS